jgi:hypothetical protein
MCIAILNKSTLLEKEVFLNSFDNNPDGIGIAYSDGKQIQTVKRMDKPEELYSFYCKVRSKIDSPILIHARIGTSGGKTLKNVHPFKITKNLAMMHNGVISYPLIHKDESDTLHLVRFIQALKNPDAVLNPASLEYGFIEDMAGYGSKFIFLHSDGSYSIINEDKGHWDSENDTWYSNDGYKKISYKWHGNTKIWNDYTPFTYNHKPKAETSKPGKSENEIIKMEREIIDFYHFRKYDELTDSQIIDSINEYFTWFNIQGNYYQSLKTLYDYTTEENWNNQTVKP